MGSKGQMQVGIRAAENRRCWPVYLCAQYGSFRRLHGIDSVAFLAGPW